MGTAARMRWPRPTVSMYCAQSGIRDVVDLLGKVPNKLSVDRLEWWVWDQLYTPNAIPVLSLALCMVIDVVFPVDGRRCHQNCRAGALIANFLAALGVTRLRVASQCAHPSGWACCVLRMLLPKWLQKVSDPSCLSVLRKREVCSVRLPAGGFGASVVYVLAGHSGVYWQSKVGQEKNVWHVSESAGTPACTAVHKCSGGMKPRYRILRWSLGSVFMLPAVW